MIHHPTTHRASGFTLREYVVGPPELVACECRLCGRTVYGDALDEWDNDCDCCGECAAEVSDDTV